MKSGKIFVFEDKDNIDFSLRCTLNEVVQSYLEQGVNMKVEHKSFQSKQHMYETIDNSNIDSLDEVCFIEPLESATELKEDVSSEYNVDVNVIPYDSLYREDEKSDVDVDSLYNKLKEADQPAAQQPAQNIQQSVAAPPAEFVIVDANVPTIASVKIVAQLKASHPKAVVFCAEPVKGQQFLKAISLPMLYKNEVFTNVTGGQTIDGNPIVTYDANAFVEYLNVYLKNTQNPNNNLIFYTDKIVAQQLKQPQFTIGNYSITIKPEVEGMWDKDTNKSVYNILLDMEKIIDGNKEAKNDLENTKKNEKFLQQESKNIAYIQTLITAMEFYIKNPEPTRAENAKSEKTQLEQYIEKELSDLKQDAKNVLAQGGLDMVVDVASAMLKDARNSVDDKYKSMSKEDMKKLQARIAIITHSKYGDLKKALGLN